MKSSNNNMGERMAILETKVDDIKKEITEIKELLKSSDDKYATRKELDDMKKIFWIFAGAFITAMIGIILKIVFKV